MSPLSCRIVVFFFLATFASTAGAATVRWILQDVTFTDGTQATGYFDFNVDNETFGHFHIDTVDGPVTPGHSYTSNTAIASHFVAGSNPTGVATMQFTLAGTSWQLRLTPTQDLDNNGGNKDLDISWNNGNVECNNCGTFREISTGHLKGITDIVFADSFDD